MLLGFTIVLMALWGGGRLSLSPVFVSHRFAASSIWWVSMLEWARVARLGLDQYLACIVVESVTRFEGRGQVYRLSP